AGNQENGCLDAQISTSDCSVATGQATGNEGFTLRTPRKSSERVEGQWCEEAMIGIERVMVVSGLTTTEAPFLEQARLNGQLYIHQPYNLYTEENHRAWSTLYRRMAPRWERYANRHFRAGLDALNLDHDRVPCLTDVNRFLQPLTGFQAKAVSGYVPTFLFFD